MKKLEPGSIRCFARKCKFDSHPPPLKTFSVSLNISGKKIRQPKIEPRTQTFPGYFLREETFRKPYSFLM